MLDEFFFNLAELDGEGDDLEPYPYWQSAVEEWDIFIEGVDDE